MKVGVVAVQTFKPIPQFGDFRSISQDKYSGMPYRAQGKRTRAGGSISQFCDLLLLLLYLVRQRLDLSLKVSHLISIILSFLKTQPKKKKTSETCLHRISSLFWSVIMICHGLIAKSCCSNYWNIISTSSGQ